jgi:hypothetical protein
MALTLKEFRQKYPQYDNVSDQKLAEGLHRKYYSSVPFDEFAAKIQYKEVEPIVAEPTVAAPTAEKTDRSWYEVSGGKLTKGLGTQIAEGAKQGLGGVSQAAIDALPDSIDQLPPGLSYEEVDRIGGPRAYYAQIYGITSDEQLKQIKAQATRNITERRKTSEKRVEEVTPEDLTLLESGLRGGAESVARNLPGIVASIATKNPMPALASAGLQTGAESYGEARAEGLSPAQAARFAGIDATIEIATELLPTKWLLDTFGAKSLKGVRKEVLKFAAGELAGEQLATFGQSVNAYLNDLDKELAQAQTLGEKAEIQARRQAVTAIATLATSGTFAGGMGATAKLTEIARKQRAREEEIPVEGAAPETVSEVEVPTEEIAPVRRPRPAVPAELGAALEGLEATELPPEVIEGVPPAVVDSARDILTLVDEGKAVNLFRARSLARQLGVDLPNDANKETTLTALRDAVGLIAAPPAAVESTVAPPIEAGEEVTVPETAQLDVLAGKEIRPPTDDIYEVAEANFNYPRMIGNQTLPIEQLQGGVVEQAGERKRVDELANQIAGDDGYFSRIIVDQNNNVIEGQHRLEALRKLGAKEVPVYKIEDMGETFPVVKMESAILKAQPMREQQATQIVQRALNAVAETGSVQEAAKLEIPGFQKGYLAALNVIEPVAPTAEVPSEPTATGLGEVIAGAGTGGAELPVPRVGAAGPEVAEPAVSGLERPSGAPERVDVREAAPAPALEAPKRKSQGIVDEESPEAIESLRRAEADESIPVTQSDDIVTPEWTEAPNGFGYRQYKVADRDTGQISTVQEVRAPIDPASKIEPAVIRRGLDYNGRPFGEVEATGTLDEVMSGKSFKDFNKYFAAKETAPAAAPTRIFESIESLNSPRPSFIDDLGRERAPSLRLELNKAKKEYDAGNISGDKFAETAGDLLLKTQKERIVRPRVRGAEYIRERLLNAKRNGALSPQGADLAEWFVRQNPLLVDDLGISIRQQPKTMEGTAGFYNPVSRITTLFNNAGDTQTAVHEILHHTEQLMPANIRANILKAYTKQLTKAAKKAKTDAERAFFRAIENFQYFSEGDSYSARVNAKKEYNKALSLIKEGKVPKSHYQYASPSEFWAINGSRIVEGRYGIPPGIVGQIKKWLREFIEKAKDLFGLTSDAAVIRALDSLAKADGKYQTDKMLTEAPAYQAVEPPKDLSAVRKASVKAKKPSLLQKAAQQFEGHNFYKNLVRKFADTTEPIMALDRAKDRAEFLITLGPDRNDIASELVRSPNIADYIIRHRVEPTERKLQQAIKNFARATGMKIEDAVNKLDSILIAIHEEARRETNYLRNVGLRNDIRLPAGSLPFAQDQPAMTPADYREYLEGLRSKLPPDQAAQIQDVMRVLVAKFKTSRGFSPKAIAGKPTPLDINDKFYDVIPRKIDGKDAYTPQLLRAERTAYRELDGDQKAAVDKVRAALAEINELERQLSREANYWSPQVDSVVASYQWGDTYVPFQGIPDADDSLDYNSKKLSGELTETAQAWDGRSTDFDSPILQSISNAKRAAGRVARKDLISVTLVNNIKQGFLRAKSAEPKKYTFDDRRAPDFDFSVLQGREKVLDYQPNGDVLVYELTQPDKIDALKNAYRELNPWLKPINTLTSWFAQYHTRFNYSFAPMDFFTNTMSNLGFISTGKGGIKEGARYIGQTLSNVARSGLFTKSANLSRALSSKDPKVLDRLMQSKDPFYREAMDFISLGGSTLQRQALGLEIQREQLVNAIGPGLIVKTGEQVARLFDIYNDMFELTSRLAAYTTHLKDITAKAKLKNIDVDDPQVQESLKREAATFALELMNFRKMGEWGRVLSAFYQFFKPGATSAKLAYNAVRKAFISAESELKNTDPAVWARLNSIYELEELEAEQAKSRPDQQKITELQNAIQANDEAKQKFINNYNMERKNAAVAIPIFFVTGAMYYLVAQMFAGDDDEGRNKISTDEMSRWTRYARMPMPGQEEFFQLPWGYGIGAFASAGAQTAALQQGNLSFSDYAGNMIEIGLDSYMPFPASRINPFDNTGAWLLGTLSPSAARGFIEYTLNLDSLGNPIYNSRIGKYSDAYSGTARAGELHNTMADILFGISEGNINWNPNTIAYMMNTYADGPNLAAENAFGLMLALKGEKDIDLKKDVPFIKRFIGRMSNFDAREFSEAERWIRKEAPKYKTFRDIRPPEEYDRYVEKHPTVPIISAMYDNVLNGSLSQLSEQRKLILRDRDLTPKERQEYLDDIDYNINAVKRNFVESYRAIREEEEDGG